MIGRKVLSDDKAHYKAWNTKFVNVMSQVRPGIREVLREIEKYKDEAWAEQDFDIATHDDRRRDRYEEWCQDMWWVLVEKTTGVASPYSGDWERYGSLPTVAQLVREADGYGPGRTSATSHSSGTGKNILQNAARNGTRP